MPINPKLRNSIDNLITNGQTGQAFEDALTTILEDMFELAATAPQDLVHTSAYLAYRISSVHMRSSNFILQAQYSQAATSAFHYIYNEPRYPAFIRQAPVETGLRAFTNLYNFHTALTRNGLLDRSSNYVDTSAPLMALRAFVGATFNPWLAMISINNPDFSARVIPSDGSYVVEIGSFARTGTARRINTTTWNMQGETDRDGSKWTVNVATLARSNDIVLLQEVGNPPASADRLPDLVVADQFGVNRTVQQYRWNLGTSSRPDWYHIYFYNVGRIRVNLAIITEEGSPLSVRDVVIISDGPGNPDENEYRPLLGVRIQGANPIDAAADTTIYSFHAISGGGINAPRMLREAAWHSETNYALGGDFNRDPRPNEPGHPARTGDWVSPPGIARIDEAAGDTHPGTNPPQSSAMLDYAVSSGNSTPPAPGIVTNMQASDHFSVAFNFDFPS